MKYLMAPMWFASFLEKARASRTRRETPCRPGSHDRQHMEMSRQGRKAGDDKVHQPPETDAHRTTDTMEGDVLAE